MSRGRCRDERASVGREAEGIAEGSHLVQRELEQLGQELPLLLLVAPLRVLRVLRAAAPLAPGGRRLGHGDEQRLQQLHHVLRTNQ